MSPILIALILLCLILAAVLIVVFLRWRAVQEQHDALRERYKDIIDVEEEKKKVLQSLETERSELSSAIDELQEARNQARTRYGRERQEYKDQSRTILDAINKLKNDLDELSEEAHFLDFGVYEPHYDFDSSEKYKKRLGEIRKEQKQKIKDKKAAICHTEWSVEGSRRKGQKMTNQYIKLVLRAFNGECDAAVAKVKYNNVLVMEKRINKSWEALNKLSSSQTVEITPAYRSLKLQELYLVHEYQEKVYEEREEQRRIREEMREEERAQKELEKAKLKAEKEEQSYQKALEKARAEVEQAVGSKHEKLQHKIEELQRRLEEAHANKERAISRAQMTRSGHVYVISNIGSFGENVYKIGMTRRLEPMDRVRELGDASVPYRFDVHAIIYSEDAPTLENQLHNIFQHRRVNLVNHRKEFFEVTLDEIAEAVHEHHGEIEFIRVPEAEEYRKTKALRKEQEEAKQIAEDHEYKAPEIIDQLLQN